VPKMMKQVVSFPFLRQLHPLNITDPSKVSI